MRLYHSSNMRVELPDTQHSRKYLDFGRGFYLTSFYEQAVRYNVSKEEDNQHGLIHMICLKSLNNGM